MPQQPSAIFSKSKSNLASILALLVLSCSTRNNVALNKSEESQKASNASEQPKSNRILPPTTGTRSDKETDKLLSQIPDSLKTADNELEVPSDGGTETPETEPLSEIEKKRKEFQVKGTDQEMIQSTDAQDNSNQKEFGELDQKFNVEPIEKKGSVPSLILGMKKIKDLYKQKNNEQALIETNSLLRYYPKSPQLLTMKGTLHQKLGYIDLALGSFKKAYNLDPSKKLKAQIEYLEGLIAQREQLKREQDTRTLKVNGFSFPASPQKE